MSNKSQYLYRIYFDPDTMKFQDPQRLFFASDPNAKKYDEEFKNGTIDFSRIEFVKIVTMTEEEQKLYYQNIRKYNEYLKTQAISGL